MSDQNHPQDQKHPQDEKPEQAIWQPEFVGTLMFILHQDQVLLIHKHTGHGAGRINGPGGKLEPGESVKACAIRETFEEVGLTVSPADCHCAMEMRFVERDGPQWLGFAFVAWQHTGTPKATDEASPFWCQIKDIPYADMWPDDQIWLPHVLHPHARSRPPMVGNFLFCNERLLQHEFVAEPSVHLHWDEFN